MWVVDHNQRVFVNQQYSIVEPSDTRQLCTILSINLKVNRSIYEEIYIVNILIFVRFSYNKLRLERPFFLDRIYFEKKKTGFHLECELK